MSTIFQKAVEGAKDLFFFFFSGRKQTTCGGGEERNVFHAFYDLQQLGAMMHGLEIFFMT